MNEHNCPLQISYQKKIRNALGDKFLPNAFNQHYRFNLAITWKIYSRCSMHTFSAKNTKIAWALSAEFTKLLKCSTRRALQISSRWKGILRLPILSRTAIPNPSFPNHLAAVATRHFSTYTCHLLEGRPIIVFSLADTNLRGATPTCCQQGEQRIPLNGLDFLFHDSVLQVTYTT